MSLPIEIKNGKGTDDIADVLVDSDKNVGLVVFSKDLIDKGRSYTLPFLNSTYGKSMNQNVAFGGTPVNIHDGTDAVYWTATSISGGKFTFDSTGQANNGTKSILVNNAGIGDTMQLDKGSTIDLSNYTTITLAIYVDKDWDTEEVTIYGYDTTLSAVVGTPVSINDYFTQTNFGVWQNVVISLSDLSLESSTIDAIRVTQLTSGSGKRPKFYLDDIVLQETGEVISYEVEAPTGYYLEVNKLRVCMADNVTSTQADGTLLGIDYSAFLGLSALSNGVSFSLQSNGGSSGDYTINQISDFLTSGFYLTNSMSDGVNTFLTFDLELKEPIILDSRLGDNISIEVADNLNGLLLLEAQASGSNIIIK